MLYLNKQCLDFGVVIYATGIDYPVGATDYEAVDIFNWQEEAAGMISQMEFIRRVDVQSETIERYVREGKLIPDLVMPMSEYRVFKYFKEETLIYNNNFQCGEVIMASSKEYIEFVLE